MLATAVHSLQQHPCYLLSSVLPASAVQEIFQEAVQNHYLSFGFASPMVFMEKQFWTEELPVYPLLEQLMNSGKYKNLLLTITDDLDEIVMVIKDFHQSSTTKQ